MTLVSGNVYRSLTHHAKMQRCAIRVRHWIATVTVFDATPPMFKTMGTAFPAGALAGINMLT
jgi:hypothetical protein